MPINCPLISTLVPHMRKRINIIKTAKEFYIFRSAFVITVLKDDIIH